MISKALGKMNRLQRALTGALLFVLLFSLGAMLFVKRFYDGQFPRYERKEFSGYYAFSDLGAEDYSLVSFQSGENTLQGYLLGEENRKGLVVMAHGVGQGAERYLPEALYFVDRGWRVFAFDGTGSHASPGQGTRGLPQSLLDMDAALTYVESSASLKDLPVMLFGHSWGGYSAAAILNFDHPVRAVATVSGFNRPAELMFEQSKLMLGPWVYLAYPYELVYQSLLFGQYARVSAVDGINRAAIPVLVAHGDQDESIAYTGSSIIAHRSEITNPNVVYVTVSASGRSGHMTLFSSDAALEYIRQKNEEFQALNDRYQGEIPHAAKVEYYANLDKAKTSELDADLMGGINDLFESTLR